MVARVFNLKLNKLFDNLLKKHVLGQVVSHTYTIEFQKRGLPHAHILLILHPDNHVLTANDVDNAVSAKIPDSNDNPVLFETIMNTMTHAKCMVKPYL